jgi:hypothetical protein
LGWGCGNSKSKANPTTEGTEGTEKFYAALE